MVGAVIGAVICVMLLQANLTIAKKPDFIDDDMLEMIKDDKAECMKEHGTTEALIEQAADGNLQNDKHITCYMSCLLTRLGMMDDDGNLDADMMLSIVPDSIQETAQQVLDKCGNLAGSDPCEKMLNMAQCVFKNCPEMWFMV